MRIVYTLLLLVTLSCALNLRGQSPKPNQHPGVALYLQSKFAEAVKSLEDATKSEYKSDAELWNYLGLAYMGIDDPKKARKAFEKSVGLNPKSAVYQGNLAYALISTAQTEKAITAADKAIALDPKNATAYQARAIGNLWASKFDAAETDADRLIELRPTNIEGYLTKSQIILAKLNVKLNAGSTIRDEVSYLKRAVDALEAGAKACAKSNDLPQLQGELRTLSIFYEHYSHDKVVADTDGNVKPLRIISKVEAEYTALARSNNVQGSVRVAAIFEADGTIHHVFLLKRLGFGLDQQAIAAVRKVKFEPKLKDGKPIPSVVTIEYHFSIR